MTNNTPAQAPVCSCGHNIGKHLWNGCHHYDDDARCACVLTPEKAMLARIAELEAALTEWVERGAYLGGDVPYKKELIARSRALIGAK